MDSGIRDRIEQLFSELRSLREDLRLTLPSSMLTLQQAAERLKVSLSTVKRLVRSGELAVMRTGPKGHPRIPVAELERYQSEHTERASRSADGSPKTVAQPAHTKRAPGPRPGRKKPYDAKAAAERVRAKLAKRMKQIQP